MADIFLSYSRTDKPRVAPLVAALEAQGWSVWWDSALAPGEEFDQVTSAQLDACKAVLVVWTPVSVASRWVRGEARVGADRGVLLPIRFENAVLPIDVRAIQTTDFDDWNGDAASLAFTRLLQSLRALIGASSPGGQPAPSARAAQIAEARPRTSICVLPFVNMSGDPEQEYFSDGISEDIITDLSKVSALGVIARNSAFAFKGKQVDVLQVARQLKVSHVLEGSVRKSGNRVRITAQLIDGATNNHIWAERYDRDLSDIFALQDEISEAIVTALKVKLLPEEKSAIEQRGTANPEAYKLYLMARQYRDTGNSGSRRATDLSIRLCKKAIEIDPNYAQAWALLAIMQSNAKLYFEGPAGDGLAEAERAIALDPTLAEGHAAKARVLNRSALYPEAFVEIELALELDGDCYEANREAALWYTVKHDFTKAIHYFEKAASLIPSDYYAAGFLVGCYQSAGDKAGAELAARRALERIENLLASEPDHGSALSFGVTALLTLGETERARAWIERALLVDPDNQNMRYNLACALVTQTKEIEAALDLLDILYKNVQIQAVNWSKVDPDLDAVREHPRFKAMIAAAEARLAKA